MTPRKKENSYHVRFRCKNSNIFCFSRVSHSLQVEIASFVSRRAQNIFPFVLFLHRMIYSTIK